MKPLTLNDMTKDELIELIKLLCINPAERHMRVIRSRTLEKRADVEYSKYEKLRGSRDMESFKAAERHWKRYEALSQESIDILRSRP